MKDLNRTTLRGASVALFTATALLLGSCASESQPADQSAGQSAGKSEEEAPAAPVSTMAMKDSITALNVPNATLPMEGLLCAGQLSPEQMDGLKALGFESFVSFRLATEKGAGWEEKHAAATGTDFTRMPVAGAPGVNEAAARQLAELMDGAEKPMVLYCGSSNRVGGLLALKAFHVDSMGAEDALALGKSAGVTGLEPKLREALGL